MASQLLRKGLERQASGGGSRGQVLRSCLQLLRRFQEVGAVDLGEGGAGGDLVVVKAALELVVRWGIYPHLSVGVGIPLQQRSGGKGAASLAAAVKEQSGSGKEEGGGEEAFSELVIQELVSEKELLVQAAEALFFLVGEGPVSQIVVSHHLVDLFSAFLQLAYGNENAGFAQPGMAMRRVDELMDSDRVSVAHAVESLMILLARKDPSPPPWLNLQAGKLLSRLVLRGGGVAAVLERMVGQAERGDVKAFVRAATHLARCPRSVTTVDEYYRCVCQQLLHLLLLSPALLPRKSKSAARAVSNMHQASVLLACSLFKQEPKLAEEYMLRPLVDNLLSWFHRRTGEDGREMFPGITEISLLDSFCQFHELITAGHQGSKLMRDTLFRLIRPVFPAVLALHRLLQPAITMKTGITGIIAEGFLEQTINSSSLNEEEREKPLQRLARVLDDIVTAFLRQPSQRALPQLVAYLLYTEDVKWPHSDIGIGAALQMERTQSDIPAVHLARLFQAGKHWRLTICLMEYLLAQLVQCRRQRLGDHNASKLETLVHSFEIISDEIGTKAMKGNTEGSLTVVRNLLSDDSFWKDGEVMEIVLHMLKTLVTSVTTASSQSSNQTDMGSYKSMLEEISGYLQMIVKSSTTVTAKMKDTSHHLSLHLQEILQAS